MPDVISQAGHSSRSTYQGSKYLLPYSSSVRENNAVVTSTSEPAAAVAAAVAGAAVAALGKGVLVVTFRSDVSSAALCA